MYQVKLPIGWRDADRTEHGWVVRLAGSLMRYIGPEQMACKLREGTARVVSDPKPPTPPAIVCCDPAVAGMLDEMGIDRKIWTAA
jgi:hypothetical protein